MRHLLLATLLTTATFVAGAAQAEPYPKVLRAAFIESCVGEDKAMADYCNCTHDEIEANMPLDDYLALAEKGDDAMMDDPVFSKAITSCLKHVKTE